MAHRKKRRSRFRPLLPPLLALVLGTAVLGGLYVYGARQRTPMADELTAAPDGGAPLSLWQQQEFYTAAAEENAAEETAESAPEYPYEEILRQEEGLTIYRIQGKRYKAVLAVIDDPKRLYVGTLQTYGWYGQTLEQIMEGSDALLGVNGGGFQDLNGEGNGSTPIGVVMVDGEFRWGGPGGEYDACAFDKDGKLHVGRMTGYQMQEWGVQYAVSYGPCLIQDGVIQEQVNPYLEPRTAVGQREDGSVLLMIIEGRQVGALGVSYKEEAEIMAAYGAINATNMDGGASSVMLYEHEMLNHPNGLAGMRTIPSAILVRRLGEEAAE